MKTILNWVLLAGLIALATLFITKCSENRELQTALVEEKLKGEQQHDFYMAWLDSCENAKIVKDSIVYVDRWYPGKTIEVPQAVDSILVANIINQQNEEQELYIKNYRGKRELKDMTLNYHIKTFGDLLAFDIESYKLNIEQHHSTAVITKPSPPNVVYKYRRGWYLTGAAGNNLQEWTGWNSIEGGIGYMTRKGIAFGADYQYYSLVVDGVKHKDHFGKFRLTYFFGK